MKSHEIKPNGAEISQRISQVRQQFLKNALFPIAARQKASGQDGPAKGQLWVSRVSHPEPEKDLQKVVLDAIVELGGDINDIEVPSMMPIQAEWVGFRNGVGENEPEPEISEEEKYKEMMKEVESDIVVLYAYGGAFMFGGPPTGRPLTTQLARVTKGRCYAPKYRLAPQHPFPAAILDILHAYLTLLYPPPGAFHEAIPPSSIVFAGESAGACLVLSAVQVLLSYARTASSSQDTILFHGHPVTLSLPAGVAMVSPGFDNLHAMPSWTQNAENDVFANKLPAILPGFPSDECWPSVPPREHPYAAGKIMMHPLVCPHATPAKFWDGCPPLWIAVGGGERILDSAKIVARDVAGQGGVVQWIQIERMPHLFIMFRSWWQAQRILNEWGEACKKMVKVPGYEESGSCLGVDQSEEWVNIRELTSLRKEEVLDMMAKCISEMPVWTGNDSEPVKGKL